MQEAIRLHLNEIKEICEDLSVKTLYLFGSATRNDSSQYNDYDFMYAFKSDLDYGHYTDNFFKLRERLVDILDKPVDLLAEHAISNPYFKEEVDKNKSLIYAC